MTPVPPLSYPSPLARRSDAVVCWVFRHWLPIFLTPLLIFVTLPFLAPVAMAAGWTRLGEAIYLLYTPFCHQLPQRSFFLFGPKLTYTLAEIHQVFPSYDPWELRTFVGNPAMGWKVAWSDRMVSFYFLTPVFGLLYFILTRRGRRIRPLSLPVLMLCLTPILLDGITHMLNDILAGVSGGGFRDTNAWLAALTANAFPAFYAGDHFGSFNWWARLLTGILAAWGIAFFAFPWLDNLFAAEAARICPVEIEHQVLHAERA